MKGKQNERKKRDRIGEPEAECWSGN